jgi:hypothetical protein
MYSGTGSIEPTRYARILQTYTECPGGSKEQDRRTRTFISQDIVVFRYGRRVLRDLINKG